MAATTPTGRRTPIANAPGRSDGSTWPIGAYASPAACRNRPGTKPIWNMPKPNPAPVSRASQATTSSRRLSRMSAALRNTAWRTAGAERDQAGKRSAAASTACRASARVPAATWATTSPVNGLRSLKVAPPAPPTDCPPMLC